MLAEVQAVVAEFHKGSIIMVRKLFDSFGGMFDGFDIVGKKGEAIKTDSCVGAAEIHWGELNYSEFVDVRDLRNHMKVFKHAFHSHAKASCHGAAKQSRDSCCEAVANQLALRSCVEAGNF